MIDDKLLWTEHIKYLTKKNCSIIGIIYRHNNLLPMHCKRNIYFALVYSNRVYCVEVYAQTNKKYLNPLITKCNNLLRILLNKPKKKLRFTTYIFPLIHFLLTYYLNYLSLK